MANNDGAVRTLCQLSGSSSRAARLEAVQFVTANSRTPNRTILPLREEARTFLMYRVDEYLDVSRPFIEAHSPELTASSTAGISEQT